jgi:hypothetical protein
MPFVMRTPTALKIGHRDLTNRVSPRFTLVRQAVILQRHLDTAISADVSQAPGELHYIYGTAMEYRRVRCRPGDELL